MNPWPVICSSLRRFPLTALATFLLVAVAVGLGTTVSLLEPAFRHGTTAAADRFDLLVGAPGSEAQLVLSVVYLDSAPLPPLRGDTAARLAGDPGVAWFSPILLGDTWKGHPVIGVDAALVRSFLAEAAFTSPEDAFAGALVGLKPGERFRGTHGQIALSKDDEHDESYTIKAKLPPTGTPWDRAVLVPAATLRHAHGLESEGEEIAASAYVVKPASVADAYRLRGVLRTERSVALFPAEILVRLYATLGNMQTLLAGMTFLAQGAVLVSVLMAVFAGMERRRSTIGVLRALGASRLYGSAALWLEVTLLIGSGGLAGLALGYGAAAFAARLFAEHTGVVLPILPGTAEAALFGLSLLLGGLAALLPALSCYRLSASDLLRS